MDANQDILNGRWIEVKGLVRQKWGKLTDDDFTRLSGKTEELAGVLQQRYGYGRAQAKIEIHNWLCDHGRAHSEV
jgi:uncharacterized protein YjbJ (UPF0337 family)